MGTCARRGSDLLVLKLRTVRQQLFYDSVCLNISEVDSAFLPILLEKSIEDAESSVRKEVIEALQLLLDSDDGRSKFTNFHSVL